MLNKNFSNRPLYGVFLSGAQKVLDRPLYSLPKKVLVINMQLHNRYILRNNKFGVAKNQEFGVSQLPGSLGKSCHWPVLSEVVERPGGGYGVYTYHSVTQGGAVR